MATMYTALTAEIKRSDELEAALHDVLDLLAFRCDDIPGDLWVKLQEIIGPHLRKPA